jgi:uncharacterized protein YciI
MFIIHLTYLKDLSAVDEHLESHRRFLDQYYAANIFLASGPKNPRDGGIIIALGKDREQLMAILEQDPFYQQGIAHYELIAFTPVKYHSALAALISNAH